MRRVGFRHQLGKCHQGECTRVGGFTTQQNVRLKMGPHGKNMFEFHECNVLEKMLAALPFFGSTTLMKLATSFSHHLLCQMAAFQRLGSFHSLARTNPQLFWEPNLCFVVLKESQGFSSFWAVDVNKNQGKQQQAFFHLQQLRKPFNLLKQTFNERNYQK